MVRKAGITINVGDAAVELKVWGPFACFTRPENKLERVSYDVMTASAARGILEAIYWKPEFQWQVDEIRVLNPIRKVSVRRNEVKRGLPIDKAISLVSAKKPPSALPLPFIEVEEERTQRHAYMLKDVAYIIKARVVKVRGRHPAIKHREIFARRAKAGKCIQQPYLGTRECTAYFAPPNGDEQPIQVSKSLGMMLHDLYFIGDGQAIPMFESLELVNGIIRLPERKFNKAMYEEKVQA